MASSVRDAVVLRFQHHYNKVTRRLPFQTLLETTGRTSGRPRSTPIGGRRVGDTFWFVSEFGDRSQYIRNIMADPNVRLRLHGRWHRGTAHLMPEDDPWARMQNLPRVNNFGVRTFGTNLLTVRVELAD